MVVAKFCTCAGVGPCNDEIKPPIDAVLLLLMDGVIVEDEEEVVSVEPAFVAVVATAGV